MKKNLFYLFALICSMSFFTACSDDDDAAPAKEISKEYAETELSVTNAGVEIPGGTVKMEAVDNSKVRVTLSGIVNGFDLFEMEAAVSQAKSTYSFSGNKEVEGMVVALQGTVEDGKATVETIIKMTGSELLKSWNFAPADFINPTLIFDLQTKSGKLTYYGNEKPEEMDAKGFSGSIASMGGMILPGAFSKDFAFTFNENGYVGIKGISNFSPEGSQNIDIPKLARYYYNPKTKVLLFDAPIAGLLGGLTKQPSTPQLGATLHIPFICNFAEKGKLEVVLVSDFIRPFLPLIPTGEMLDGLLGALDAVMPGEMVDLLPWVKGNIKTIAEALASDDLKDFTLGCRLSETAAK